MGRVVITCSRPSLVCRTCHAVFLTLACRSEDCGWPHTLTYVAQCRWCTPAPRASSHQEGDDA